MSVFIIYIDNNIQFSSYVQVKLSKYLNKYSVKYVIEWLMDKVWSHLRSKAKTLSTVEDCVIVRKLQNIC